MLKKPCVVLLVVAALMATGCVLREDLVPMENRLLALEQRNMDLVRQVDAAESKLNQIQNELDGMTRERGAEAQDLRSQSASIRAELSRVQEDLKSVSGRIEETQHSVSQITGGGQEGGSLQDLARIVTNNSNRLLQIERYLNMEPGVRPPTISTGDTAQSQTQPAQPGTQDQTQVQTQPPAQPQPLARPEADLDDKILYAKGKQAFDKGDHQKAREYFSRLLETFPKSPQADNAQFWIGETYYREKWYEKAILEYQNVIEKYPKGNKVPAALLKQGLAFQNLGDTSNSRLILMELVKKYPESNEAKISQRKLDEMK